MGGGASVLTGEAHKLILPGVSLPNQLFSDNLGALLDSRIASELQLVEGFAKSAKHTVKGKKKSDPNALDKLREVYVEKLVKHRNELPSNYKYFGNGNNSETLRELLLHNPFFTSTLVYRDRGVGFAIETYSTDTAAPQVNRYTQLLLAYDASLPRVNVTLDTQTLRITSYRVFTMDGKETTSSYTQEQAVAYLLAALLFYTEIVHATVHIYDLIMVTGILHASDSSPKLLFPWAQTYVRSVLLKEKEVESLLFSEHGSLVGGGFKANRTKVLDFATYELLKPWLHYSTYDQFVEEFIFAHVPAEARSGLIPEYLAHASLIPGFADDFIAAVTSQDNEAVEKANVRLETYFNEVGKDIASITNLSAWIHGISAFGLLHGNTFSYTRLFANPSILSILADSKSDEYDAAIESQAITSLATTEGLEQGRHVFSSDLLGEEHEAHPALKHVLKKYDDLSQQLKKDHYSKIKELPNFIDYGWIWTDYGPDVIDNKQLTLTTYV